MNARTAATALIWAALALAVGVGVLGRGYWTPDEPREADIAWRMSWQPDKAVPLLAGEAFCEKPPLTYWIAGSVIALLGDDAWSARLPNLLYAWVTALATAALARRAAGRTAGLVAAAAISTFLLSYQVSIWLATDAPLLAAVSVSLLGVFIGFHAVDSRERLLGYSGMHAALALGFLSKSAAAWMVPVLTLLTLVIWERRFRELLRIELYAGLLVQAAIIVPWVWWVYVGPQGPDHLKVFFWNNLAGRFARVDAPAELQYAGAHRNSPGKYLMELPIYLWPWTLLVAAAARRAFLERRRAGNQRRLVRLAVAAFLPTLAVLSLAATARNIYLAPALPGLALLLGWWATSADGRPDPWDTRAVRATALLITVAAAVCALAAGLVAYDGWSTPASSAALLPLTLIGLGVSIPATISAWRAIHRGFVLRALAALLIAYCALLCGPAAQIYRSVDAWQDLAAVGRAMARDADGRDLVLFAQDETTRAFVDMYVRATVAWIPGPIDPVASARLTASLAERPRSLVVAQLPGRNAGEALHGLARRLGMGDRLQPPIDALEQLPLWALRSGFRVVHSYALPNGRRYALMERR